MIQSLLQLPERDHSLLLLQLLIFFDGERALSGESEDAIIFWGSSCSVEIRGSEHFVVPFPELTLNILLGGWS